jgi:hypothetical protein
MRLLNGYSPGIPIASPQKDYVDGFIPFGESKNNFENTE